MTTRSAKNKPVISDAERAAFAAIRAAEWGATTKGQPTGMGLDNGPELPSCPCCNNTKSEGHARSCKIRKALALAAGRT